MLGEMLLKAKIEKTSLNLGMCVLVSLLLWNSWVLLLVLLSQECSEQVVVWSLCWNLSDGEQIILHVSP